MLKNTIIKAFHFYTIKVMVDTGLLKTKTIITITFLIRQNKIIKMFRQIDFFFIKFKI